MKFRCEHCNKLSNNELYDRAMTSFLDISRAMGKYPMPVMCVDSECDKEADRTMHGNSYCKEHAK